MTIHQPGGRESFPAMGCQFSTHNLRRIVMSKTFWVTVAFFVCPALIFAVYYSVIMDWFLTNVMSHL